jgi:hypothetical protein
MHTGLCWGHLKEGGNSADLGVDGGQIKMSSRNKMGTRVPG